MVQLLRRQALLPLRLAHDSMRALKGFSVGALVSLYRIGGRSAKSTRYIDLIGRVGAAKNLHPPPSPTK